MKKNRMYVPGMRVPRPIVFLHGFVSGRCKAVGLDPETGLICSGYITEKLNLYDSLSHDRVKQLEDETKDVRSEAFGIMVEEVQIRQSLDEVQAKDDEVRRNELLPKPEPVTIQEIRDARKRQAVINKHRAQIDDDQQQLASKHKANIKRLGEIEEKIRSCELKAQEEMESAAARLQSIFATYTKGALLRPVQPSCIPVINRYDFELYKQSHEAEDKKMRSILAEVYSYE